MFGFGGYQKYFKVYRRDNSNQAYSYMNGLLQCERGKANMERMEEEKEGLEYHRYQHFISNSPWDDRAVIAQVGQDLSSLLEQKRGDTGQKTGLIIDESGHLKSGTKSVGVARQYSGVAGKVDNCQIGVYASLVNGEHASFVEERLFLPKQWIESEARLNEAKVPLANRQYKTKPELALEMIDSLLALEVNFDWVGGDGLYGHNYELSKGLDERFLLFVLDVHKDQHVYLEQPLIYKPKKQAGRGRTPTKLKTQEVPLRVDKYKKKLEDQDWERIKIRKTAKGWLKAWVHTKTVWIWDGKEEQARKRVLVIRKIENDIKYSLSNGLEEQYSKKEFALFQAQRYWVERNFDDAKSELGMSDYQVRKWIAWHHHHAILFMAMLFMLKERIKQSRKFPLMSVRDARIMVTTLIAQTMIATEPEMLRQINLMKKRHIKRKRDIDRNFNRNG